MDLLARSPSGRLDPLAACRLLWSGMVGVADGDVEWNGETHRVRSLAVDSSVASLYALAPADVEAVVPDIVWVLDALAADEALRVEQGLLAGAVRDALACGQLTGASLFLLQAGPHPLIVERGSHADFQVRYDERLARGVPDLQGLLCRMLAHLHAMRGGSAPFAAAFVANPASVPSHGIAAFEGTVEGARPHLQARVEVEELPACLPDTLALAGGHGFAETSAPADGDAPAAGGGPADVDADDLRFLRATSLLERHAYATEALARATRERVTELGQLRAEVEKARPDPDDERHKDPPASKSHLLGGERAARKLVVRSAVYVALGIVTFVLGSRLVANEELAGQIVAQSEGAMRTALDGLGIFTGQFAQVGGSAARGLPMELVEQALRVIGVTLMGLAILVPVRRIIRLRRRLDREVAYTRSHVDFLTALSDKRRYLMEASYSEALDAWATGLKEVMGDAELAEASLSALKETAGLLEGALGDCYAQGLVPESLREVAAVCTMRDYLEAGRAGRIAGELGAAALWRQELSHSQVSAAPERATEAQPTLRALARRTGALVADVSSGDAQRRRERVEEHCHKAQAAVVQARRELAGGG